MPSQFIIPVENIVVPQTDENFQQQQNQTQPSIVEKNSNVEERKTKKFLHYAILGENVKNGFENNWMVI